MNLSTIGHPTLTACLSDHLASHLHPNSGPG